MANLKSTNIMANEVVKAVDINNGNNATIDNVAISLQTIFDVSQDFVIGGDITLDTNGWGFKIKPVYGVCTTNDYGESACSPVVESEEIQSDVVLSAATENDRRDIIEIRGEYETGTTEQRAFIAFDTGAKVIQDVDTVNNLKLKVRIKQSGTLTAPEKDDGWIKIAEILIPAAATKASDCTLYPITADVTELDNDGWTTDKQITINVGRISDVNKRFRVEHNVDGTYKSNSIGKNEIITESSNDNRISGNEITAGGKITCNGVENTDTILNDLKFLAGKIDSIFTKTPSDTNSPFYKLMLLEHPVGSLYISSKSDNPSTLFGGTWKQIKDCFIWAKGDNDTADATGGSKTVTLGVANLPSHKHTFTGSEVTSGGQSQSHTHTLSHTHSVTAQGKVTGGNYSFSGTTVSGYTGMATKLIWIDNTVFTHSSIFYAGPNDMGNFQGLNNIETSNQTGSTNEYTRRVMFSYAPAGSITVTTNPTFSGTSVTSGGASTTTTTNASQDHTHKVTASGTVGNTGSGTAVNIMNPYVVKYVWERTA